MGVVAGAGLGAGAGAGLLGLAAEPVTDPEEGGSDADCWFLAGSTARLSGLTTTGGRVWLGSGVESVLVDGCC